MLSKVLKLSCKAPVSVLGGVQQPALGRELQVLRLMPVEVAKRSQNPPGCPRPSSQAAFMHLRGAFPGGGLQLSCFSCLLSVSLCGGNGLGGQCQCRMYLGFLDAKMMFLTAVYVPLPPSLPLPSHLYLYMTLWYLLVSIDV